MIIKSQITGKEYSDSDIMKAIHQCIIDDKNAKLKEEDTKKAELSSNQKKEDEKECVSQLKQCDKVLKWYNQLIDAIDDLGDLLNEYSDNSEKILDKSIDETRGVLSEFEIKYGNPFSIVESDRVMNDISKECLTLIGVTNHDKVDSNSKVGNKNITKKFCDDISDMPKDDVNKLLNQFLSKLE